MNFGIDITLDIINASGLSCEFLYGIFVIYYFSNKKITMKHYKVVHVHFTPILQRIE